MTTFKDIEDKWNINLSALAPAVDFYKYILTEV